MMAVTLAKISEIMSVGNHSFPLQMLKFQEIRTLEGKLIKQFSEQLAVKVMEVSICFMLILIIIVVVIRQTTCFVFCSDCVISLSS